MHARRMLLQAVFAGGLVAICLNALLFASKAANPLVISDGWYFVDTVIRRAAEGHLSFNDLFIKRSALDHSQPLRKLIMLLHYRFLDLDFGVEAIIGVLAACLNLAILWAIVRRCAQDPEARWLGKWLFLALAAVYLSLNAPVVFSWPLLTLSYTGHLFVLAGLVTTWWALQAATRMRLGVLLVVMLAMDMVADDTGLVASIAAMLAVAIWSLHGRDWRAATKVTAVIVFAQAAYRLFYLWVAPVNGAAPAGRGMHEMLAGLAGHADGLQQAIAVPLAASVAHRGQLRQLLGAQYGIAEVAIPVLLVVAHLWFWWRAVAGRRNAAGFVATALMLMFYGLVAGLLLARVSQYGFTYLWQPRYVMIYEWNLVALLLMAIAQVRLPRRAGDEKPRSRFLVAPAVAASAATALLLLQFPLSVAAWQSLKFTSAYQQRMALQLGEIARDPTQTPDHCIPQLTLCKFDARRRASVVRLLQEQRLNLFSPAFRARNRLYPDPDALPK
ncbi:MAG: hypothetical protein QM719_05195 [Thermomonas sp.]